MGSELTESRKLSTSRFQEDDVEGGKEMLR